MRAALSRVAKWVKAEKLSQEDAMRLLAYSKSGGVTHNALLVAASKLLTATNEVPVYDGGGTQVSEDAMLARKQVWAALDEQQAKVEGVQLKKAKVELAKVVKAGQLTPKEARRLVQKAGDAGQLRALTAAAIQAAPSQREPELEVVLAADYEGVQQDAAPQFHKASKPLDKQMQRLANAAREGGVRVGEIQGLLKWARIQMSEGLAGKDLDILLGTRFSTVLLGASSELLTEVRGAHEGLAGRLYVDAAAYASPKGSTGCEKGATRHRANNLKHVLAMSRCASCASNIEESCQKYGKKLVDEAPVENRKAFQKEALRLANAPDSVQTAAMFDTSEFQLDSDPLSTIELDPELPAQTLSNVLFGGIELP